MWRTACFESGEVIYPEYALLWWDHLALRQEIWDDAIDAFTLRSEGRCARHRKAWDDYVWDAVDHSRKPRRGSRRTLANYLKFHPFFLK